MLSRFSQAIVSGFATEPAVPAMTNDTPAAPISSVRPLTRMRRDGVLCTREPEVEAQVRALNELAEWERRARLQIAQRAHPQFVREEALVYWLRAYDRRGEAEQAWQIAEILVGRVAGHVARKLARWRLGPDDGSECAQDLFGDLRAALFDHAPTGEFWEVRFWVCLDRRLWNLVEKRQAVLDNEIRAAERSENDGNDFGNPFGQAADAAPGPAVLAERREALALLTENERVAVFLRYVEGLPEESEDPDRPSIARVLDVTGRTVRNYLRRAEEKLRAWERGEEIKETRDGSKKSPINR